jgi:hypothetical protein
LDGKPNKLMVHLVTKGFQKVEGVDFEKIFVLVVKWSTFHSLAALVAHNN